MGLHKVSIKRSGTFGGQRLEKGMSVEVVYPQAPVMGYTKGKEAIITAYRSKYNIDVSKLITSIYMEEVKIN